MFIFCSFSLCTASWGDHPKTNAGKRFYWPNTLHDECTGSKLNQVSALEWLEAWLMALPSYETGPYLVSVPKSTKHSNTLANICLRNMTPDFTHLSKRCMADVRRVSLEITGLATFQQHDRLLTHFLILQSLKQPFPVEIMQSHWHRVCVEAKTVRTRTFPGEINIHF